MLVWIDLAFAGGIAVNHPSSQRFDGVSVGSDGSIYVSCDKSNEVVRLKWQSIPDDYDLFDEEVRYS